MHAAPSRRSGADGQAKQNTYRLFLLLILIAGIALRVWDFREHPRRCESGQGDGCGRRQALADYGTDRFGTWLPCHLYAWGYGQMSSLMSYLIAPLVALRPERRDHAHPSTVQHRRGACSSWLFMRDVFGERAGLIAALLVAINFWHLIPLGARLQSSAAFLHGRAVFPQPRLTEKKRFLYISMLFFGLCMYCCSITIYTVPLFLVAVCAFYMIKKRVTRCATRPSIALVYLLIAWPFIPHHGRELLRLRDTIKAALRHHPALYRQRPRGDILFFSDKPIEQLIANFKSLLNVTLLQVKDLPWNDMDGFGTMYLLPYPSRYSVCSAF